MVKTFEHSQAPLVKTSHTGLIKAWTKRWRPGSDSCKWSDANDAPPVYRVDLTRPVINLEHGKAARNPALVGPRPANRKASPGEAAMGGSKKLRPACNGPDMPTSIWSLVVRSPMEPILLRKANDDRRPSIGASQNRPQEGRVLRLSILMAKVASD